MSAPFLLYIDPGTGSLLIQIVVGGAVASAVFFKRIWYTIFPFLKRKNKDSAKRPDAHH